MVYVLWGKRQIETTYVGTSVVRRNLPPTPFSGWGIPGCGQADNILGHRRLGQRERPGQCHLCPATLPPPPAPGPVEATSELPLQTAHPQEPGSGDRVPSAASAAGGKVLGGGKATATGQTTQRQKGAGAQASDWRANREDADPSADWATPARSCGVRPSGSTLPLLLSPQRVPSPSSPRKATSTLVGLF